MTPLRDRYGRFVAKAKKCGHCARQHAAGNKKKYSVGLLIFGGILLQAAWDITANDLSAYFAPVFTHIFGPPPSP